MSLTITAQTIPAVASSPWEVVDAHLHKDTGDWVLLREGLIHAVCERVTRDGRYVKRLEEVMLGRYYDAPQVRISFLDVLTYVQKELSLWPQEVLDLVERVLARNPHFPRRQVGFSMSLDDLRALAPLNGVILPVERDLDKFRKSGNREQTLTVGGAV